MFAKTTLAFCALGLATSASALKEIPKLGLGTWLSNRDSVAHAVEYALDTGYTHIDAAWIYRNEDKTGQGIAASSVAREDLWITSKLWNLHHRPEEARIAINTTLTNLGVDYLDLYLIHWPVAFVPGENNKLDTKTSLVDTWRVLEEFARANLTRHIGISNFAKKDVETILDICTICPYAHEFETHPYLQQQDFVDWHKERGIKVIAYSPLANTNPIYRRGDVTPLLKNPFWVALAARKNATVAQTAIAWGFARGTIVIPKSEHEKYLDQNREAQAITFTEDELAEIAKHDKKVRLSNPSKTWGVPLFADLDDHSVDSEENVDEL